MPRAEPSRVTPLQLAVLGFFASFGYLYLSSGGGGGDGTTIDGISFPAEIKMGGVRQQLTGGGTRTKYGVAKVYAVALYLDGKSATSSLKRYANGGKSAANKQPFFDALISGSYARTLFLQFHRSVTGMVVAEAMAESLTKRLSPKAVEKFRGALLSVVPGEVPKGTKVRCSLSRTRASARRTPSRPERVSLETAPRRRPCFHSPPHAPAPRTRTQNRVTYRGVGRETT